MIQYTPKVLQSNRTNERRTPHSLDDPRDTQVLRWSPRRVILGSSLMRVYSVLLCHSVYKLTFGHFSNHVILPDTNPSQLGISCPNPE